MTPYIIKALQKGDSICVNDLGTFSLHYVPASISGKVISAPHNIVTFDAHSGSGDYAFTDLVCFEKKCLITQASAEITQWVEKLKQALNNNKSVAFEGFGTFSLNDKGKISFSCDHIPELNIEFEGLEELHTDQLWSEGVETEDEGRETEEPRPETEEPRTENEEQRLETEDVRLETEDEKPQIEEPETEEQRTETEEEPVIYRSSLAEDEESQIANRKSQIEEPETEEQRTETEDVRRETEDEESQIEELETEDLRRKTEDEESQIANRKSQIEEPETEEQRTETEEEEPQVANRKSQIAHRKWLWWLLVLLLLAALGAAGYLFREKLMPVYDNVKEKFTKKEKVVEPTETETIEVITPAEEEEVVPEEEIVEEVPETPAVYTPEEVKRTADSKYPYIRYEAGHFYTIVGSLPSEGDAEKHIRNRGLDKYEPKLVLQNGVGNIRVCIGIFDSEEEAESFGQSSGLKYWVLK